MDNLLLKLRESSTEIKSDAFDVLNDGYRSEESNETKSDEILDLIYGRKDLYGFRLKDIIKLIRFIEKL